MVTISFWTLTTISHTYHSSLLPPCISLFSRSQCMIAGSEEIEAVTVIDTLVRAGASVTTASVGSLQVVCSRGVKLVADKLISECTSTSFDLIVLPGGMPGATNLHNSLPLQKMLQVTLDNNEDSSTSLPYPYPYPLPNTILLQTYPTRNNTQMENWSLPFVPHQRWCCSLWVSWTTSMQLAILYQNSDTCYSQVLHPMMLWWLMVTWSPHKDLDHHWSSPCDWLNYYMDPRCVKNCLTKC